MSDETQVNLPTAAAAFLLYLSLCIFRIANALLIQTQFDPDEYWQTLEPAYCEAFPERGCAYTWEWTRQASADTVWWMQPLEGPIRSYLSVLPTYILYVVTRMCQWDKLYSWIVPKGPVLLHAVLVAAPTDLATWYMGQWVGSLSDSRSNDGKTRQRLSYCCLLCSITCWFNGYALIRTYSNSAETMLLAVSLALVSPVSFMQRCCSECVEIHCKYDQCSHLFSSLL
jgi:phosphatidylinositol glycan class B